MIHKNGFTLIELIVGIVLISILALGAVMTMPKPATFRLASAKARLEQDIRLVQTLALNRQTGYGLRFEPAIEQYSAYQGNLNYANIITNPADGRTFIVSYASVFPTIQIVSTSLGGGVLQFNRKGIPADTVGTLNVQQTIVLSDADGKTVTVTVLPRTGLVR